MNSSTRFGWEGSSSPAFDTDSMRSALCTTDQPIYLVNTDNGPGVVLSGQVSVTPTYSLLAAAGPIDSRRLGSATFRDDYHVSASYMAGAMANGISSIDLVVALANAGYLASYGAAGQLADQVEAAILKIRQRAPGSTFAVNLIHSPNEPAMENSTVNVLLKHHVNVAEVSAFMNLTEPLVRYRLTGIRRENNGNIVVPNKIIAKVSRTEIATHFLGVAPRRIVDRLYQDGHLSAEEATMAQYVRMADDITAEGDSGGHTDRRPTLPLLQILLRQRNEFDGPGTAPRIGAAGGIGSPGAIAAVFAAGADYVVTGSVNQSCVEAGTSDIAREMLTQAGLADFAMAPAADMLEIGAELQVLRKGTFFPQRGSKLGELYRAHESIEDLSSEDKTWLEEKVLRASVDEIWQNCVEFFGQRDPGQIAIAERNPKKRMALIFRWYLGLASRWANVGDTDHTADYQIWAGPALADFNSWVRGTSLENADQRYAADVAALLMQGAAVQTRQNILQTQGGVRVTVSCSDIMNTMRSGGVN